MFADVFSSESFLTLKQTKDSQGLKLELADGTQLYSYSKATGYVKEPGDLHTKSGDFLCATKVGPTSSQNTSSKSLTRQDYDKLKNVVFSLIGKGRDFEVDLLTTFIIATYVHQLFDSLPNLWLYSPAVGLVSQTKRVLRELCFNATYLPADFGSESTATLIDTFTPTVILHSVDKNSWTKWGPIITLENSKTQLMAKDMEATYKVYSPKLMISSYSLPRILVPHTFTACSRPSPDYRPDFDLYSTIRRQLMVFSVECSHAVQDSISSLTKEMSPHEPSFPLIALAQCLQNQGVLTTDEVTQFTDSLKEIQCKSKSALNITFEQEFLAAALAFVEDELQYLSSTFISLSKLARALSVIDTIDFIDAKTVSRLLNKYQLISDRKRIRVKSNSSTWNTVGTLQQQETHVAIDVKKLRRLTYFNPEQLVQQP
ncbi:MAG: hypothetical protein ACKVRP_03385 [Bacteroidota bacterium]